MSVLNDFRTISRSASESASNPPPPEKPPAGNKVLIVDDDPDISDAVAAALSSAGLQVKTAQNGKIGLEMTASFKPDVILLDLMMPVMDGLTILKQLRSSPETSHLPVIVLTNAGDIDNLRAAKTYYGVSDFLIKANVEMDDLINKIRTLLPHK